MREQFNLKEAIKFGRATNFSSQFNLRARVRVIPGISTSPGRIEFYVCIGFTSLRGKYNVPIPAPIWEPEPRNLRSLPAVESDISNAMTGLKKNT